MYACTNFQMRVHLIQLCGARVEVGRRESEGRLEWHKASAHSWLCFDWQALPIPRLGSFPCHALPHTPTPPASARLGARGSNMLSLAGKFTWQVAVRLAADCSVSVAQHVWVHHGQRLIKFGTGLAVLSAPIAVVAAMGRSSVEALVSAVRAGRLDEARSILNAQSKAQLAEMLSRCVGWGTSSKGTRATRANLGAHLRASNRARQQGTAACAPRTDTCAGGRLPSLSHSWPHISRPPVT